MAAKTKLIQKNVDTQELNMMMEQILNDKGDPEIVAEKQKDMTNCISICMKLLSHITQRANADVGDGLFVKLYGSVYDKWLNQINKFVKSIKKLMDDKPTYKELKDHTLLKRLMFICRDLKPYSYYLDNQGKTDNDGDGDGDVVGYDGNWINNHPGRHLEPFSFSNFNLKDIWEDGNTDDRMKKYLLTVIKTIFDKCKEIYELVSSPDVDISQFSKIIIEAISKIKKTPELNRCGAAFKKLEESVGLLEGNFSSYYKDMLQSQNPNLLIVNFIQDVSETKNMDLKLVYQFKKIVTFYKKQTQGKIKDPEIKKKFEMLSNRFNILEQQVTELSGGMPHQDSDDEEEKKADDSSDTEDEQPPDLVVSTETEPTESTTPETEPTETESTTPETEPANTETSTDDDVVINPTADPKELEIMRLRDMIRRLESKTDNSTVVTEETLIDLDLQNS